MFSFNLDVGWGTVLLLLGTPAVLLYLFLAFNIIAFDHAKRSASGMFKKPNIAVISLNGVIRNGRALKTLMYQIERVRAFKVKAVIIKIDSPGGYTATSHEIYDALKALREDGIRVVAYMGNVVASGGVYVAMGAEKIVATPGTLTGSIGVIMPHYDLSEVLKLVRIKPDNVKAGKNKDIGSMAKPMTDEGRKLMQEAVDDIHSEFCRIVATSRNLTMEKVREFADGRVFSAERAKAYGLIDEIGAYRVAEKLAIELSQLPKEEVEVGEVLAPVPFFEKIGLLPGVTALIGRAEDVVASAEANDSPMYLWKR